MPVRVAVRDEHADRTHPAARRPPGSPAAARAYPGDPAGTMFWFSRNRFVGS
jgi:hypothetical protein